MRRGAGQFDGERRVDWAIAPRSARFPRPALPWSGVLGGLLVVGLLLGQHIDAQTPLTAINRLALLAHLAELVLVGLFLLVACALGLRLLHLLTLTITAPERIVLGTTLGLGAFSLGAFGLGMVGLYRAPVLCVLLAVAILAFRRDLRGLLGGLWQSRLTLQRQLGSAPRGAAALAVLLALGVGVEVLGALAPPQQFDALAYHLTAPARFLASGWIAPLPDVLYGNLPLGVELLYGFGLAVGSTAFAQLLHLAFGVLTAIALWTIARRYADRATAWLAVALFLATPLTLVWARVANIDLALACFLLLAMLALLRANNPVEGRRWALLGGIFAGLALGTKYQALFAVPLMALLLAVDALRARRGGRELCWLVGCFCGAAVLFAAPWYLKNWLLLGNPLWPLFFGGRGFGPLAVELTDYFARGMTISPRTPLGYALLPLRAYTRGSIESPFVIPNPLFVLLPGLVWLPRRREILYPLVISLGLVIGWALGFQELRYLIPVCAPLSLAVATVLRALLDNTTLRRFVLPGLYLAALITVGVVVLQVGAARPLPVVLGLESRDAYLRQSLATGATYRATTFLAEHLQSGETVRFFNDAQIYYVPYPTEPDHLDLALIALMEQSPAPDAALAALRSEGVDYLFVNEANIRYRLRFDPDNRLGQAQAAFEQLTPLLEPIYRDGSTERPSIIIYRVPPGAAR